MDRLVQSMGNKNSLSILLAKPGTAKDIYALPREGLSDAEIVRLNILTKLRTHVVAVICDNHIVDAPVDVKQTSIKSLVEGIVEVMEMCSLNPATKERQLLLAATHCISMVFNYSKDAHDLALENTPIEHLIHYLLDVLCKNYVNCSVQIDRFEFVSQLLLSLSLESDDVLHHALESLAVAIKSSLNRINRTIIKTASGIINMAEVDILFHYLHLMEQVILSADKLTANEVIKLKSIERTATNAIPYPVIGVCIAKLAAIGESRSPEYRRIITGILL